MKNNRQTQRTLKWLRDQGFSADVVERVMPKTFIRRDYLGIIDIIAVGHGRVIGVQVTSPSNFSSHRKKINESEHLENWLGAAELWLCGWELRAREPKVENWPPGAPESPL